MATKVQPTKTHGRSIIKTYLLVMTLVGVIGTLISGGILLYTIGNKILITNEEYILGERFYELESCKYNNYDGRETTKPTKTQITICEKEKKEMLIKARQATYKTNILRGSIRTVLFAILLIIHYPKFIQQNKKE